MIDEKKFRELLNLHLDHRLSSEEAALLERALAEDPARRRTFQAYAAMQRGCAELFRRSASDAPAPDSLIRALRQAESRMVRRTAPVIDWRTWGVPVGLAAAVALVVARLSLPTPAGQNTVAPELVAASAQQVAAPSTVGVAEVAPSRFLAPSPGHLAMVAHGISSDRGASDVFSRWSDAGEAGREESGPAFTATWEPEGRFPSSNDWPRVAPSPRVFSSRPIDAWSGQSGYQVQSATFSFER